MKRKRDRFLRLLLSLLAMLSVFWIGFSGFAETIDGIVAVVNGEIITLVDVRIIQEFGLHEFETDASAVSSLGLILDKLIDQELVIQLTSEDVSVEQVEVDSYIEDLVVKLGERWPESIYRSFGLVKEDLQVYVREHLLCRKIISQKFKRGASVNLREIKTYYDQVYVPQRARDRIEPKPMVELLGQIESAIKQEKIRRQVEDWLQHLRQKADIQLFTHMFPDYFEGDRTIK